VPIETALDVIADHKDIYGFTIYSQAFNQGNINYAISSDFSMSGNWKLTFQVRKDGLDNRQDFEQVVE
jgi:hypothetical protein